MHEFPKGCLQKFTGGTIYQASGMGAYIVFLGEPITSQWKTQGWETGKLGYPIANKTCKTSPKGCLQKFQKGTIYDVPGKGAYTVFLGDPITSQWKKLGWEAGKLGYPIGNKRCTTSPKGCLQRFQKGTIYQASGKGTYTAYLGDPITSQWGTQGWETGKLGYPLSNKSCNADTCFQRFQGGRIHWSKGHGTQVLRSSAITPGQLPFFVYGTLRTGGDAFASYLKPVLAGKAMVRMPGLQLYWQKPTRLTYAVAASSSAKLWGEEMYVKSGSYKSTMTRLDAYERYNPAKPTAGAYMRTKRATTSGTTAWVYETTPAQSAHIKSKGVRVLSNDYFSRW